MASTATTTAAAANPTTNAPADGEDDAYFAQRQSTMDSATLDKLLRAEKHLFHAGQATLQAWKLIGRDPDNDQPGNATSTPNRTTDADLISASSATTASSSSASSNAMPVARGPASAPAGMFEHASPGFLSTSPRLPFEIPRPEGRASIGQFSTRTTMSLVDNEINFLAENGRSKSSHANIFGFTRDSPPRSEVTQFNFTVRKSDSVLEKLGSKKASIQLQVDIEARMLNFLSPHDNRESYSCAAVTARPQSRLGMQLKIQTGTTSITKKITFLSSDDRTNFMDALEQGKVMCKKSVNPFRATPENAVMNDECSVLSNDSTRSKIRESMMTDQFALLPGEEVLEHVQRVTNLVVMSQSDRAVQGVLKITTYRITFSPYDSSWKFGSFEVPLATIDVITRDGLMLLISCKDLRTLRLAMHDAYTRKKGYDQMPSTPDFRWLNLLTLRMKPPNVIGGLFAFDYFAEKKKLPGGKPSQKENGWMLYSPVAEYQRLGFLRGFDTYTNRKPSDADGITWRLLKNSKFRFSPTYPQLMVVPSLMTEEQLVQSARFRSRARLPIVVWRHPVNKCVLARSSQPNYGMAGNRSEPDRILLRAYRDSANKNSAGVTPPLHIIDARKPIATKGNRLKGKGVENSTHYDNAQVEFMGIANIHKMRESLEALKGVSKLPR
ncbi:hypothetical protein PINS_up001428 [Pythium insidiosum]|nr:hypothetical protein PINS_up001428 [Pythium insidiosum]